MYKLLATLLLLASCGTDPRIGTGVDPVVRPYLSTFEHYYGRAIDNVPVSMHDVEPPQIGWCFIWMPPFYAEIILDMDTWARLNDYGREILLFHELGHCVLGRPHDDRMRDDGCPKSIMKSSLSDIDIICYALDRDYYIKELFIGSWSLPRPSIDRIEIF